MDTTHIPQGLWIGFGLTILVLVAVDLWSYREGSGQSSHKKDLAWTGAWIAVSLIFGGVVWGVLGPTLGQEYFAAYAMEKALSLDNLFVFFIIFSTLKISQDDQHRVLFWGIIGAVVFRGLFIFLGIAALERWEWITNVFAAILIFAAWKALSDKPDANEPNGLVVWLSKHIPIASENTAGHFIVKTDKGRAATPLLLALIAVELADVMFAIDSVPAALSITHDPFLVYSSNIFAILGLRALYLCVSAQMAKLRYLNYGLAAVLAFAGLKILLHDWLPVPPLVSAGIVVGVIAISIVASLRAAPIVTPQNP
jgi:tellurite resistance protein TerC